VTHRARGPYSERNLPRTIDNELAALEHRLATLLAHARALRAANEALRNELAQAHQRNRDLAHRVQQATARLDALLARIPAE
jgi:cell division protein FtsB